MKEIKIKDFITIKILELDSEKYIFFVDYYNEKYFYIDDNNRIFAHQLAFISYYDLYFQKANIIYRKYLDKLEKNVYELHRRLTFRTQRAKSGKDYYVINTNFNVIKIPEQYEPTDNVQYNSFNYFLTEEEATKYAKKLHEYLMELIKKEYIKGE